MSACCVKLRSVWNSILHTKQRVFELASRERLIQSRFGVVAVRFSVFNVHCVADKIIGVHNFLTKPLQSEQINPLSISAKIKQFSIEK